MLRPVRTVAPSAEAVTADELKEHCRVDGADHNDTLAALAAAAVAHFDGWSGVLGRCLVTQSWRVDLCDWPAGGVIRLPFPDVTAVSVVYRDADDVEQTVSSMLYGLHEDARGGYVRFRNAFTYPGVNDDRDDAVQVTLTAGFGAAPDVPADIRQAIKMLGAHWFENREAIAIGTIAKTLPLAIEALTRKYMRKHL